MYLSLVCCGNHRVDWWSFGILIYELLYGFTPFRGKKRDETFNNILKRTLTFPEQPEVSDACKVRKRASLESLWGSDDGPVRSTRPARSSGIEASASDFATSMLAEMFTWQHISGLLGWSAVQMCRDAFRGCMCTVQHNVQREMKKLHHTGR